ncbi:hypothetical protein [Cobetia sp. 1CM21F]|uniref:pilus assembly PilX family protein n=1 Tax=unclassified Cobetia TaxID=2609414 RepID=UPI001DFFC1C6|nr:hypothetical protein [Cobetia sp. 1CM21F]MBR9799283.1 hypothetical protein [Gammaproteobacteria bacterium]MCK8069655.1 hypothetical protein [Cobetia sp. 1CM21F]
MNQASSPRPPRQQGMALLVVLIMLIVVGVMAVTGNEDTQLQTRMLMNTQFYDNAYAEAESLQQQAESRLLEGELTLDDFGGDGFYDVTAGEDLDFDPLQADAWEGEGVLSGDAADNGNYVIEYLGETTEGVLNDDNLSSSQLLNAFRITAAGWSLESAGDPDSKKRALAVVQSEIMMAD